MDRNLARLAERRKRLVNRAAVQRVALAQNIAPWHIPLALADRSISAWHFIKRHPKWMAGGVVVLVALGPGRVGSWVGRGLLAWRVLDALLSSTHQPENPTILPGDT
jgi:hypothetical protein